MKRGVVARKLDLFEEELAMMRRRKVSRQLNRKKDYLVKIK